eukprot:CAMPEP_0176072670 /NCGR_PEP_ID=MMETSP0120_2-20121206/36306_1 /TAXON_ID=160619 /ORGANISM="Kryptoperidinium foliaceum, Strain CCMP 1326" /LENGTH=285 /DNA_ID=CAMNT_0017406345 /DNA_START=494 /DNA_END=1348 /DNA_ORIENTATION=+
MASILRRAVAQDEDVLGPHIAVDAACALQFAESTQDLDDDSHLHAFRNSMDIGCGHQVIQVPIRDLHKKVSRLALGGRSKERDDVVAAEAPPSGELVVDQSALPRAAHVHDLDRDILTGGFHRASVDVPCGAFADLPYSGEVAQGIGNRLGASAASFEPTSFCTSGAVAAAIGFSASSSSAGGGSDAQSPGLGAAATTSAAAASAHKARAGAEGGRRQSRKGGNASRDVAMASRPWRSALREEAGQVLLDGPAEVGRDEVVELWGYVPTAVRRALNSENCGGARR